MDSRSEREHSSGAPRGSVREFNFLSAVHQTPDLTQRELARRSGLSVGATNLLLQNLVRKGYLRIRRAGWRRWLYALTPSGVRRKVALTAGYVDSFLDQYSQVRLALGEELRVLAVAGEVPVAVYGRKAIASIVQLVLSEMGVRTVDVYLPIPESDALPGLATKDFAGLAGDQYKYIVVADHQHPEDRVAELLEMGVDEAKMAILFKATTGTRSNHGRLERRADA